MSLFLLILLYLAFKYLCQAVSLESFNSDSPLEIQKQHDEAFDVEVVTQKFFSEYSNVFQRVEKLIQGIDISERKRLYTQKLFNRLMFVASSESRLY